MNDILTTLVEKGAELMRGSGVPLTGPETPLLSTSAFDAMLNTLCAEEDA